MKTVKKAGEVLSFPWTWGLGTKMPLYKQIKSITFVANKVKMNRMSIVVLN